MGLLYASPIELTLSTAASRPYPRPIVEAVEAYGSCVVHDNGELAPILCERYAWIFLEQVRKGPVARTGRRKAAVDTVSAVSGAIETLSAGLVRLRPTSPNKRFVFGVDYVPIDSIGVRVGQDLDVCAKKHKALVPYKYETRATRSMRPL